MSREVVVDLSTVVLVNLAVGVGFRGLRGVFAESFIQESRVREIHNRNVPRTSLVPTPTQTRIVYFGPLQGIRFLHEVIRHAWVSTMKAPVLFEGGGGKGGGGGRQEKILMFLGQ